MNRAPFPAATIVGYGSVGRMFGGLLHESGCDVARFDLLASPGVRECDVRAPSSDLLAAIAHTDLLLLALPEQALADALATLGPELATHALLVETASVKTCLEPIKKKQLVSHEILGVNPMFAPSLGMSGRPVAVSRQHPAAATARFEDMLKAAGAVVVDMSPERHDRIAANTQALAHAAILGFADALRQSGDSLDDMLAVAPPPFRVMTALVARMLGQSPEVYWDIQAGNPHAADARLRLAGGVAQCSAQSAATHAQSFALWLGEISRYYGSRQEDLGDLCAHIFAGLPGANTTQAKQVDEPSSSQTSVSEEIS